MIELPRYYSLFLKYLKFIKYKNGSLPQVQSWWSFIYRSVGKLAENTEIESTLS